LRLRRGRHISRSTHHLEDPRRREWAAGAGGLPLRFWSRSVCLGSPWRPLGPGGGHSRHPASLSHPSRASAAYALFRQDLGLQPPLHTTICIRDRVQHRRHQSAFLFGRAEKSLFLDLHACLWNLLFCSGLVCASSRFSLSPRHRGALRLWRAKQSLALDLHGESVMYFFLGALMS